MRRPRYKGKYPRHFKEKYKELNPELYPEEAAKVQAAGKTPAGTHRSVMVEEVIQFLAPKPGEVFVDATLGFGGHTRRVLEKLGTNGRAIGIDVDPIEIKKTESRLRDLGFTTDQLQVVHSNYSEISSVLEKSKTQRVDLVLADLGLSSMQIDDPSRGFTFKFEGPLDLRMNPNRGQPASKILKTYGVLELARLFKENSDEKYSEILAHHLVGVRAQSPIQTTQDLYRAIEDGLKKVPKQYVKVEGRSIYQRIFQALRIEVNGEFEALEKFLESVPNCLKSGGRVVVLSFHSGEDRRVKKAFQKGFRAGIYSSVSEEFIRPTPDEVRDNPRARPTKLRWAIRA